MPASLLQRLGQPADSRLLIVNADDFGMCHAENLATCEGLDAGVYSSATVMVPCPWFDEAAAHIRSRPGSDVGVHLTHTSEWETYRWGPVAGRSSVPSLVDDHGRFHPDIEPVYRAATLDDVERECRAQIEQAMAAGIDVTHVDSHMGTMQLDRRYHALYLRLGADYGLPVRMMARSFLERMDFAEVPALADQLGVLAPDFLHFGGPSHPADTAAYWNQVFDDLRPGVSEIYVHAGCNDPELRACCPAWEQRVADHAFFSSAATTARLRALGIGLIGYRALRDAQRAG